VTSIERVPGRSGLLERLLASVRAEGIVKLFENACGAVDVSGGRVKMVADCVFQAAAAVMIWFQTAKRSVISVRHWGALIR
jgi:hypothetical protein